MKIVIAPAYHSLHTVIADIVNGNYTAEHIYCQRRNTVERIVLDDGSRVVVKRFKQPNALNRWVYGIFRKSKARRAYEHALRLTELGVDTPTPIAYILHGRGSWQRMVTEHLSASCMPRFVKRQVKVTRRRNSRYRACAAL